jgi:hypothetical protein
MEPENPGQSQNPLFSFIQTNPATVVIILVVLILVTISSILFMARLQSNVASTAENSNQSNIVQENPTARPTFTPVPTATFTPPPTQTPIPTSTRTPTPTPIPSPTPTFTPTPIVIGWRELGELDTLEVSTVTVFEEINPRWWIVPDARVLVRVTGLARFGIDITLAEIERLAESEGNAVRIVLPHATVTGVELLDAQVYDEQWFPNAALGVDATQKALNDIESWATEQENLLEIAEKLAKAQLENFLRQLGFEDIEIVFE